MHHAYSFHTLRKSKSLARQNREDSDKAFGRAFIVLRKHLMGSVLGPSQLSEDYFHTDNLEISWEGLFAFNFECHYGKGRSYRISFFFPEVHLPCCFPFFTGRPFLNKMVNHTRWVHSILLKVCCITESKWLILGNVFVFVFFLFVFCFWMSLKQSSVPLKSKDKRRVFTAMLQKNHIWFPKEPLMNSSLNDHFLVI